MMLSTADILNASLLEQMLREAGYARVASTMNPHEACAHRGIGVELGARK